MKKIYMALAAFLVAMLAIAGVYVTREPASAETVKDANAASSGALQPPSGKKALVVYFSYTGNTRALAQQVQQSVGGDIFELKPSTPYSADYKTVESQGKKEVEEGYQPPLAAKVENLASYDVIFVGTPIWWYTIAPPVATFLANPELAGKTIIPFCTHGGYGAGRSMDDIKKLAPNSTIMDELVLRGSESYDAKEIDGWLRKAGFVK